MTSAGLDGPASRATGAGPIPRLVASDLDGTLLDTDGRVSDHTRTVWSGLGARGIETIVVTARPPRWLDHLAELVGAAGSSESTADDVGAHTLAICANGAFVYDLATRRVIEADGFTADEALAVVEHLRRRFPDAGAAVETERGMFRSAAYPDAHAGMPAHDAAVRDCELTALPPDVVVGKILLRDEAWRWLTRATASSYVDFWTDVVRRSPTALVPGPAAVLAFAAWLAGEGALAWCAVDRAREVEPEHSLAGLVADMLMSATAPDEWDLLGGPSLGVA